MSRDCRALRYLRSAPLGSFSSRTALRFAAVQGVFSQCFKVAETVFGCFSVSGAFSAAWKGWLSGSAVRSSRTSCGQLFSEAFVYKRRRRHLKLRASSDNVGGRFRGARRADARAPLRDGALREELRDAEVPELHLAAAREEDVRRLHLRGGARASDQSTA